MRRAWQVGGLLLVLAGAAWSQGSKILGRDDGVFARKLYERGYPELAEVVCDALIEAGGGELGARGVLQAQALLLEVRQASARQERDLPKRREIIARILADSETFLEEHAGTPEAEIVRNNIQEVTLLFGETLAVLLKTEEDPKVFDQLRKEGQASFSKAQQALRERIETLRGQMEDPEIEFEPLEAQCIIASYDLARTHYFYSLLFAASDPQKAYYLEQAVQAFQDFSLDYGDQLLNFEGLIYQGLCYKGLGKNDEALAAFDESISLRESWPQRPDGRYEMPSDAASLVSSAVLQKVLLLTEMEAFDRTEPTVQDFLDTVPDPLTTSSGLALLAALGDAQIAAGDSKGADATARKLIEADPTGPWGATGRELQGLAVTGTTTVTLDTKALIQAAEQLAVNGRYDSALEVCRRAIGAARGATSPDGSGVDGYLLMGSIYVRRGLMHEASMAFDAAVEEFPRDPKAAEALYRAFNSYIELFKMEGSPFYRRASEERKKRLVKDFGTSSVAAKINIAEGKELEAEHKLLEAAKRYEEVASDSPDHHEAQYRAGNCYLQHANNLLRADKKADALPFFERAENLLKPAIAGLEKGFEGTLDRKVQATLGGLAFGARVALVQLYLTPGLEREKDVFPILDEVDAKYAFDPGTISRAWGFRIQALEKLGKVDEAVAQLDILMKKDPKSRGIPPAAAALARALEGRAVKLLQENPQSSQVNDLYKKAATYYLLSVDPERNGNIVARSDVVEEVASRLYIIGLHFNHVPEGQASFVGWDTRKTVEPFYWERAAALYEKVQSQAPSYLTAIRLGRTYGFLGAWSEAALAYENLFDAEPIVDEASKRFIADAVNAKPELVHAYLEWGVVEHQTGILEKDAARQARAAVIFERMLGNVPSESATWWLSKYFQIRGMMDRGDYQKADFFKNEIARSTSGVPASEPALKERFEALFKELEGKVFK